MNPNQRTKELIKGLDLYLVSKQIAGDYCPMAHDGSIENDFQNTSSYKSLSPTRGSCNETARDGSHELNILDRTNSTRSTETSLLIPNYSDDSVSAWTTKFTRFQSVSFSHLSVSRLVESLVEKESFDRQAPAVLAGWNVTNLIQGMGILGVPYAVREGGLLAVGSIFIVAMLCDLSGILLVDCLYEISPRSKLRKRVRESYIEVGNAVWPRVGGKVVVVVQTIEMYSAAVLYLILLTAMFSQITAKYIPLGMNEWAVVCSLAVLPTLFIRRLSLVAWMSMIAVFSLMSALMVIISYCIVLHDKWTWDNIPAFNINTFPVGFGIVTFSFCA